MADFQASIGNIVISPTLITVQDTTDYAGSTQDGHLTSYFSDYRKIIMTNPTRTFVYSTLGDGDVITSSGDSGVVNFNFTLTDVDIDGVYDFTLYTVPTFDDNEEYDRHDCVFYNDKLYKALVNGTAPVADPATSSEWKEISEDLLSPAYCVTDHAITTDRNLLACYEEKVAKAVCELKNDLCGDICDNKAFSEAAKLMILVNAICTAKSNNDYKGARKLFNLANQLCDCSCNC